MNIDFISDLHMEINGNVTSHIKFKDGTKNDVLILVGDRLCYRVFDPARTDSTSRSMRKRFTKFIVEDCHRYEYILYIPGNHEYYGFYMEGADDWFGNKLEMIDRRLVMFNNKWFHSKYCNIIGSAFWTSFSDPSNPYQEMIKKSVEDGMNDYHVIKKMKDLKETIDANYTQELHRKSFEYIKLCQENHNAEISSRKLIVATHHGPSFKSHSTSRYGNSDLKYGYLSEYGNWIADTSIDCWIHGHTHHNVEYEINNCRVTSAMYGYLGHDRSLSNKKMEVGRIVV